MVRQLRNKIEQLEGKKGWRASCIGWTPPSDYSVRRVNAFSWKINTYGQNNENMSASFCIFFFWQLMKLAEQVSWKQNYVSRLHLLPAPPSKCAWFQIPRCIFKMLTSTGYQRKTNRDQKRILSNEKMWRGRHWSGRKCERASHRRECPEYIEQPNLHFVPF